MLWTASVFWSGDEPLPDLSPFFTFSHTLIDMIRNKKHSELYRAYQEQKRELTTAEEMIKYLSYDYQLWGTKNQTKLSIGRYNTEYNVLKESRNECRKRCIYLKR